MKKKQKAMKKRMSKIKRKGVFFLAVILFLGVLGNAATRAELVHNSLQEIEACKGKLKLELVRVWGGDEEEDEKKFFKTPVSVAVDKKVGLVYICDQHSHCVRVFKDSGEYVRTIGQRGRGPGDLYSPRVIAFSPFGDLMVYEFGGYRIQCFSPDGKSKQIVKLKDLAMWFAVTSKNEFVVYDHFKTISSRRLIFILNQKGKKIREIGAYHDKRKNYLSSEKLSFAIDDADNIYAVNRFTPVIRKYSPAGELLMAVTFEPPYEIPPVEVTLNLRGDEIIIKRDESEQEPAKTIAAGSGDQKRVTIQNVKEKGAERVGTLFHVGIDSQKRIYVITMWRLPKKEENSAAAISGSVKGLNRDRVNYDIVKNIDIYRLLVFSPKGKTIAEAKITGFCDGIYVNGDNIFIVDGLYNQRILEYRMRFEE